MSDSLLSIPCTTIKGEQKTLADFGGKALLVVNTASKCGFTPQYQGLEALWEKYRERGLVVLGFPQPVRQAGTGRRGRDFAVLRTELRVSFPLFRKIEVNGAGAHPLFVSLKKRAPGLLGSQGIKWNFTKFLIGRDGQVVSATRRPPPEELSSAIEALLE